MATAPVFNGNIMQALLSLRKQLQRDQIMPKYKNKSHFQTNAEKKKLKQRENAKRHKKKKKKPQDGLIW